MRLLGEAVYVSAENSVRRYFQATKEYVYKGDGSGGVVCRTADIRAAADALAALADEMETRVVELGDYRIIITPQGKTVEHYYDDGTWDKAASGDQTNILAAYDAGKADRDE